MRRGSLLPLAAVAPRSNVGGKAFALGEMLRAGFKIPNGFVLIAPFPAALTTLEKEILANFDQLRSQYVAVRSSAIGEDGIHATWAGQLDSFLNVDREHLLHYIQKCQSSAHSERAESYAKQHGIDSGSVAVIVQAMIQSEVSGVAFSTHPVTKNKNHIVIEATFGLGEALVSGEVTPDRYVAHKHSGKIVETQRSAQSKKLVQGPKGTSVWQPLSEAVNIPKLQDKHVIELAALIYRLEEFYGFPVDVEWGFLNQQFYILQSRPITTLS